MDECKLIEVPLFNPHQLKIGRKLNEGNYGAVYRGTLRMPSLHDEDEEEDFPIAAKFPKRNPEALNREAQSLLFLKHPQVIHVFGVGTKRGQKILISELLATDFVTFLQGLQPLTTERTPKQTRRVKYMLRILVDIANGMSFLEEKNFVHRDLAARNILLTTNRLSDARAKIADFGLSRHLYEKQYYAVSKNWALPYRWCAPEVLEATTFTPLEPAYDEAECPRSLSPHVPNCAKHTIKSDVWSFGVMLWEVATLGELPFGDASFETVADIVVKQRKTLDIPESFLPEEINELMKATWKYDPDERPTFASIKSTLEGLYNEMTIVDGLVHSPSGAFSNGFDHVSASSSNSSFTKVNVYQVDLSELCFSDRQNVVLGQILNKERLDTTAWCTCGSCEPQKTPRESFCCQEIINANTKLATIFKSKFKAFDESSQPGKCICKDDGFRNVCYNYDSLLVLGRGMAETDGEKLEEPLTPGCVRRLSYRSFSYLAFRRPVKDLPSCVVAQIRKHFPNRTADLQTQTSRYDSSPDYDSD